eukprot:1372684-Amphidinium_carterae.1
MDIPMLIVLGIGILTLGGTIWFGVGVHSAAMSYGWCEYCSSEVLQMYFRKPIHVTFLYCNPYNILNHSSLLLFESSGN